MVAAKSVLNFAIGFSGCRGRGWGKLGVREGGAGDVRRPPGIQAPTFQVSLGGREGGGGGRGLVHAPRRVLRSL